MAEERTLSLPCPCCGGPLEVALAYEPGEPRTRWHPGEPPAWTFAALPVCAHACRLTPAAEERLLDEAIEAVTVAVPTRAEWRADQALSAGGWE